MCEASLCFHATRATCKFMDTPSISCLRGQIKWEVAGCFYGSCGGDGDDDDDDNDDDDCCCSCV
jgi:hypothetical protein